MTKKFFYYLDKNQAPQGPVTLDEIRRLAVTGDLSYCREGEIEWLSFAKHPPPDESAPQRAAQPPPIPPPAAAKVIPPPVPAAPVANNPTPPPPPLSRPIVSQSPSPPPPPVTTSEWLARIEGAKTPRQPPPIPAQPAAPKTAERTNGYFYMGPDNQPHGPVSWQEVRQKVSELQGSSDAAVLRYRLASGGEWLTLKKSSAEVEKEDQKTFALKLAAVSGNNVGEITFAFIAINVLVYVVIGFLGGGWLSGDNLSVYQTYGASSWEFLVNGGWWRLVTSMFLHFGILHLLFNMVALWQAGVLFERLQGRLIYIITYFACGIFSGLVSAWYFAGSNVLSAGASGAIFGIYGALGGVILRSRRVIPASTYKSLLIGLVVFVGYNVIYGASDKNVDMASHVGGLVCGFVMGLALAQSLDPEIRKRRYALSVVLSLVLTAGFIGMGALMLPSPGAARAAHISENRASRPSLDELRAQADQGNSDAQYDLALRYDHGDGVTQDYAEAMKWYQKAAAQGNAGAQNNIGALYANGQGVTQDYAEAMKWYRKAADQGNAMAQTNLGDLYDNGNQDYAEAMKWYQKAAAQGDAGAQTRIGLYYDKGQGVPQDYAEAMQWYQKAAAQGDADAQRLIGILYLEGDGVTQDYAGAMKWFRKAAGQDDAGAQDLIGALYAEGNGVTQDYAEAAKWYRKAADQGNAHAQYDLGELYAKGQGVEQNMNEALVWLRKSADQGNTKAQEALQSLNAQ